MEGTPATIAQMRAFVRWIKDGCPCADQRRCRGVPLEARHKDCDHARGVKRFNVSLPWGNRGANHAWRPETDPTRYPTTWEELGVELLKCDVVCKLCHVDREHERRQLRRAA